MFRYAISNIAPSAHDPAGDLHRLPDLGLFGDHGTCLCFEPLGPKDTDFILSTHHSLAIAEAVQLDAKAIVENNKADPATFATGTAAR